MKRLNGIVAWLIILLGLAHTAVSFYCREFDEDGLWFFGSGIALILAGLFNLLYYFSGTKLVGNFTLIVNALLAIMFCAALTVLSGGQVYFGITIFLIATIVTAARRFGKDADA